MPPPLPPLEDVKVGPFVGPVGPPSEGPVSSDAGPEGGPEAADPAAIRAAAAGALALGLVSAGFAAAAGAEELALAVAPLLFAAGLDEAGFASAAVVGAAAFSFAAVLGVDDGPLSLSTVASSAPGSAAGGVFSFSTGSPDTASFGVAFDAFSPPERPPLALRFVISSPVAFGAHAAPIRALDKPPQPLTKAY
ncbi:MAG: hypothetical protein AAF909_06270 [Pseudomonadota bacterium]